MRIVERKYPVHADWHLKAKCTAAGNEGRKGKGCGSILEIEKSDLRFYDGNNGCFQRPDAVMFKCPVCGRVTDLAPSKWPKAGVGDLPKFSTAWADAPVVPAAQ